MSSAIAWVEQQWGHPDSLGVPVSDRGLGLADGVFETLLIRAGSLNCSMSIWALA